MINWVKTHPKIDSQYILTLHRISFRYSEKDINKSFEYYEKVSNLSDSLNYTYGKSLSQINLGLLLFTSANYDASNSAYFRAIEYAESSGAQRLKAVSLNNIGEIFRALKDLNK
jgi:tetratricopeptide (TPR) repeat protein